MITMDCSSGVIVYLSQQCVDDDIAIVSSKCSEMNIVLPSKVRYCYLLLQSSCPPRPDYSMQPIFMLLMMYTELIILDKCEGKAWKCSDKSWNFVACCSPFKVTEIRVADLYCCVQKEEDDPVEIPVPEQFETRVRNGKLETTPISHVGA